jgi:putative DNA primase/helicase
VKSAGKYRDWWDDDDLVAIHSDDPDPYAAFEIDSVGDGDLQEDETDPYAQFFIEETQFASESANSANPDTGTTSTQASATPVSGPTGQLWPEPANPRQVALRVLATSEDEGAPLRYWKTLWFRWLGTHYQRLSTEDVRDHLYDTLADALYTDSRGAPQPWKPTEPKLNLVIDAMRGLAKVPEATQPPCWINFRQKDVGAVIPCANGLLRISDRKLMAFSDCYFNLFSVPYSFDAEADCPRWRRFLTEVFGEDIESIRLLQDWFYYVLTGRTDLHKMLLWIGPKRGGKGTVARILKALIGPDAYAGLSAESVGRQFGLQGVIHKSLGVFPDEDQVDRTSGKRLVSFIKTVTGEDDVVVDIKLKEPWNGRLPIRFMYQSNQMPVLPDPSGAVLSRLLVMQTRSSFLGKEDSGLEQALSKELPGILNWALDAQLAHHGRFVQPSSSADLLVEVDTNSNPVREFLLERTKFGPDEMVPTKRLFDEFDFWRQTNRLTSHGDSRWFGRSLRPAMLDLAPQFFGRKQHDSEPGRPWYYHGVGLLPAIDSTQKRRALHSVHPLPPSTDKAEDSGS